MLSVKPLTLNGVTANFQISRPSISKHIKILRECGLIVIKQKGRERYCEAKLKKLKEVHDWAEFYRGFWDKKLLSLKNYLEGKE